jgi:hypothetical protein
MTYLRRPFHHERWLWAITCEPMKLSTFLAAMALSLPCVTSTARAQSTVPCRSATNHTAVVTLGNLRSLVSGNTETDSIYRASAQLPRVAAESVTIVGDAQACDSAARALAVHLGPSTPVDSVWVIAIGASRYVVFSDTRRTQGRLLFSVFDSVYSWLVDIL